MKGTSIFKPTRKINSVNKKLTNIVVKVTVAKPFQYICRFNELFLTCKAIIALETPHFPNANRNKRVVLTKAKRP